FAQVLDASGAGVVLASRRSDRDAQLASELTDALAVPCDIRRGEDREALVAAALERFGRIDVLVNNAGVTSGHPPEEEPLQSFRDKLETNTVGLFALTQLVARHMLERGSGSVINMASIAAYASLDRSGLAGYVASKAGVVGLTRDLAAQWGRRGVRVNAIAPGWFPAETTKGLRDPDLVSWISERTAMGRPGRIDELDGALLFLATDASSYLTGQVLTVDGGWTCF
ncbi:MAG: SDR family oxidoreductase, partial [Solirubrobacterales bacterium]|nr:SDR family oxidoreductase [Solirubrobacterales bacterium]